MIGLRKNVASQKIRVFAFDRTNGEPETGDAANITCKVAKDWGAASALTDTNPTEVEDGFYLFDLTASETNATVLEFYPQSSTTDIQVIYVPSTYTQNLDGDADAMTRLKRWALSLPPTGTPWNG